MEGPEQSLYVAQLKAEFDSCDASSSGFLDRCQVGALCRKLHLDSQLPLLVDSLLGGEACARVDFEAFKDNFVDVLSRLDVTWKDDGDCLQLVIADEVKPKFVKGEKRYGRRSRPDVWPLRPPDCSSPVKDEPEARRSMSLDSAESLKHSEQAESDTDDTTADFGFNGEESTRNGLAGTLGWSMRDDETQDETAPPGPAILSRLDSGSGRTDPEAVLALWAKEDVHHAHDILRMLEFSADEPLSLSDLTAALDEALLAGGDGSRPIRLAALVSYKDELYHLRALAEQAHGERDQAKTDLERAERRNLRLVREADERHAAMEAHHADAVRDLGRDFRERMATQRRQADQDSEAAAQQLEDERRELQLQLETREERWRKELQAVQQEKHGLEEELVEAKRRLSKVESDALRLRANWNQLLQWHGPDAVATPTPHLEDKATRLLDDYERRCRELQDKNDELSSELELLRSRRESRGKSADIAVREPSWLEESGRRSDDMSRRSSRCRRAALEPDDAAAPLFSVEMEFAMEKLKSKYEREMRHLNARLDTQVSQYERRMERDRQSAEAQRKDMAQTFQLEISELQGQKLAAERQVQILKETLDEVHNSVRKDVQERRNANLRLEAELKIKTEQQVATLREDKGLDLFLKSRRAKGRCHALRQQWRWEKKRKPERWRTYILASEKMSMNRESNKMVEKRSNEEKSRTLEKEESLVLGLEMRSSEKLPAREALERERATVRRQKEELLRLSLEKRGYMKMADQLSMQIVEMEEEMQALREGGVHVTRDERKMKKQLVEMEKLVLLFQEREDQPRSQLEEARSDNVALQERLCILRLDQGVTDKRRKSEEMTRHDETGRQEVESLSVRNSELSAVNTRLLERLQEQQEAHETQVQRMQEEAELRLAERHRLEEELSIHWRQEALSPRGDASFDAREMSELVEKLRVSHGKLEEGKSHNRKLMKDNQEKGQHNQQLLKQADAARPEEETRHGPTSSGAYFSERHEKAARAAQQRSRELQAKLVVCRDVLRQKVLQLQGQMAKNVKSSAMLKELYVENSQLSQTLQLSERDRCELGRRHALLEEKLRVLHQLLRDLLLAALHP
ncbi:ninein-like protein isoform X2 [Corythoichthys intestinalis]|uniref:ninein-like protein isoform X2 n=1 Tax=Corythoichthys intestinalis TaxID=161448 RepID=UPI0025A5646F|nr:ninein-like protein isoform X2 [Corythoichthys intestinalis]